MTFSLLCTACSFCIQYNSSYSIQYEGNNLPNCVVALQPVIISERNTVSLHVLCTCVLYYSLTVHTLCSWTFLHKQNSFLCNHSNIYSCNEFMLEQFQEDVTRVQRVCVVTERGMSDGLIGKAEFQLWSIKRNIVFSFVFTCIIMCLTSRTLFEFKGCCLKILFCTIYTIFLSMRTSILFPTVTRVRVGVYSLQVQVPTNI